MKASLRRFLAAALTAVALGASITACARSENTDASTLT
ncbi:MAG: hypothetical protein QOI25_891, partial [Mycobacterium sp.]|nr:hypothetical protein [Mycobacterium sp.]